MISTRYRSDLTMKKGIIILLHIRGFNLLIGELTDFYS